MDMESGFRVSAGHVIFYYYRQPIIKKVEPLLGLIEGGTPISITGAWFDEKIEYGVFPFCKLGDNVVRGRFISTTRVQCNSPPTKSSGMAVKIEFSLNGADWIDTGHNFKYLMISSITHLDIRLTSGSKFNNLSKLRTKSLNSFCQPRNLIYNPLLRVSRFRICIGAHKKGRKRANQ